MSLDPQTAFAAEMPLIRSVPLDDLLAAYEDWDEEDDAILAKIQEVDTAIDALGTALGQAGVSSGAEAGGRQLDSADEAVSELNELRAELAKAHEVHGQARQALADAQKEAEASLTKLGDLRLARIVVIVLALLLAFLAVKLVFGL
jgi:hypothetical protein